VSSAMYGWEDEHVSIALVKETEDPSSYREAIGQVTTISGLHSWSRRRSLWIEIKHEN